MVPQPFCKRELLEGWVRVSAPFATQSAPGQAEVDWIVATNTTKGVQIPRPWVDHPFGEKEITLLGEELLPAMAVLFTRGDAIDRAQGFPIADFDAFRSQPLPNRRRNPWESPPNTYGIPRPVGWLHHGQMQAASGRGH